MRPRLNVSSEVAPLKKVIVHYPDDGIEIVTPSNALEFLYDDIVYFDRMRKEHTLFWNVIEAFIGKNNVYDTEDLLYDILDSNKAAKTALIDAICVHEKCEESIKRALTKLNAEDLVYTIFTGFLEKNNKQIFSPLPNYIFTRDIGVMVNDHVIVCQAAKHARTRENLITRTIIYHHPVFKSVQDKNNEKIIDMTTAGEEITLEGGDVMIFDKDHLIVGVSERTTEEAFEFLKKELFDKNVVQNIVKVNIPKERTCMHIDTLFTQVSTNEFVTYEPYTLLNNGKIHLEIHTKGVKKIKEFTNLKDCLKSINPKMEFIICGNGESPHDEREQWTDGCNLVALKDGVCIAYERNPKTQDAFEEKGYKIIDGESIVSAYKNGIFHPDKVKRTIIFIHSTELSRARGGPHCMTFPVLRG
jgi:arginine deiminase